jgi:5-hydroxyisourate hydrolase-like protein (transthyretin family)
MFDDTTAPPWFPLASTLRDAGILPLALLVALAVPRAATAQAVIGHVLDEESGEPVVGAQVSLLRDTARVRTVPTDSAGSFAIPVLRSDTFTLRVQHVAYETTTSRPFDVGQNDVVEVELRISQRRITLDPLIVTARRDAGTVHLTEFYERLDRYETLGKGVILSRSELERHEGYAVRELLGRYGITFRRTNPFMACQVETYWNGMRIESVPDDQWNGSALRDLPISSVEGVEIYRDRFDIPPEYTDPEVCGVVLVWSRPLRPGEGNRGSALLRLLAAVGIFALLTVIAR